MSTARRRDVTSEVVRISSGDRRGLVSPDNGDGTFNHHAGRPLTSLMRRVACRPAPALVVDVTGDGRADIVGFGNAGVYVCATTATAPSKHNSWSSGTLATTPEAGEAASMPALRRRRDGRRSCGHRRLRKRRGLCLAQQRQRHLPSTTAGRPELWLRRRLACRPAPALRRRRDGRRSCGHRRLRKRRGLCLAQQRQRHLPSTTAGRPELWLRRRAGVSTSTRALSST